MLMRPVFLKYLGAFVSGFGFILAMGLAATGRLPDGTELCKAVGTGLLTTGFFRAASPIKQ